MEIITYMDNRKTSYRPHARLVRKPENARKNQRFGLPARAVNIGRRNREKIMAAVHERRHAQLERILEGARLLWWYVTHRSSKVLLLLAMVAMGFCLSAGMRELGRQVASIARPVDLPYLPTEELEAQFIKEAAAAGCTGHGGIGEDGGDADGSAASHGGQGAGHRDH